MRALVVLLAVALQDGPSVAGPVGALVKEYQKAEQDYQRKKGENPAPKYLPKFQQAARATRGDQQVEALYWVFKIGIGLRDETGPAAAQEAAGTLLKAHAASPKIEQMAGALERSGALAWARDWLREASQKARDPKAKLTASMSLAVLLGSSSKKEERDEAVALLKAIMKSAPESPQAKRAGPLIFEFENLQIGCTAPDFESKDVDGKTFKLSDYRGKVVIVDFWGFW